MTFFDEHENPSQPLHPLQPLQLEIITRVQKRMNGIIFDFMSSPLFLNDENYITIIVTIQLLIVLTIYRFQLPPKSPIGGLGSPPMGDLGGSWWSCVCTQLNSYK